MASREPSFFESVFNHLVLPPKLPDCQDGDEELAKPDIMEWIGTEILTYLLTACATLREGTSEHLSEAWSSLESSLRVCEQVRTDGIVKESLLREFRLIQSRDFLTLHLVEQNAALLIRRNAEYVKLIISSAFAKTAAQCRHF
jgi:hypothetical protein